MFKFSHHCFEQLKKRGLTEQIIIRVVNNPSEKIVENGIAIYQNSIEENSKTYLLRVFVNENKIPPLIITAYKTSKLKKY